MTDGGGHAADLTVFAFDEFEGDPAIGDGFSEADGWVAWRQDVGWLGADGRGDAGGVGFLGQDVRRGFEESGLARAGEIVADDDAAFELAECFRGGNAFDLDPVFAGVSVAGVEESGDEGGFVGEEEQTFGVGVEAADGVDARG